jgi:transmembrane sensor
MMRPPEETIRDAIAWRLRLRDGDAQDWEAFARWLEADAARSDAYDVVSRADADFDPATLPAAPAPAPVASARFPAAAERPRRRWFAPAAAAAAAAILLAFSGLWWSGGGSRRYEVATAAGEHKTIVLPGTGSIELNGSSRLLLDHGNARYAELAAGEAAFTIRHDASHPFDLIAGDHAVRDLGTVFNVVKNDRGVRVEVAEGTILFDPAGPAIRVAAGQSLRSDGDGRTMLARNDPHRVAGWRRGQLSYEDSPLAIVVEDLARTMGADIRLDPRLAGRSFTGSIHVDRDQAATLDRLSQVLGLGVRRAGRGWILEPPRRAHR